ncbi:MMPL family transporter [Nocardia sp. NPDC006630]|uniref:MMPL family transporter n=1 Tax=Nocardia sp. NPDC006630 TaxID=3157181 RepID=UPI0033A6C1B9
MFTRWGDLVYRLRYSVLGIVVAALLSLGAFGFGLEDHLSSSGWDDPTSSSSQAAVLRDSVYGRDHSADVLVLYTAPDGKTIDDPAFSQEVVSSLNGLTAKYPEIDKVNGAYWKTDTGQWIPSQAGTADKKHAFAAIAIKGDNDTDMLRNYRKVKDAFAIPGVKVEVAGLQPVAGTLNDTMQADQKRMELIAIPAVAILLFFIFGGVVAAALPLIVGGLTVLGANGIIMALTKVTDVNSFVSGVVSMIGLGLAIDYGLFIVSRFREELAEGYDTKAAVRRTVMTAGRTVMFSATMIVASLGGMLLFPQGFLKSIAYATIATVALAALSSITILPALLAILGPRVDAFGLKWFNKTKSNEEIEAGFWGKLTAWVMKHPLKVAIPICVGLLLLIIPVKNLAFGGISETYLPPDNPTRLAQQHFDEYFPLRKSAPVQLIIVTSNPKDIGNILTQANKAPGLVKKSTFSIPATPPNGSDVWTTDAQLESVNDAGPTIDYLRSMDVPDDAQVLVGGQPAIQQDSISALLDRMPLMIGLVVLITTILMFLTFGSLVLPIKAALMSALGLGSTLGILTWIFVDGHGAGLLNFTPQPIMSPVLVLIIAVIYGLSTDYEVFLLSRMVEARTMGASTTEAVRAGTAQTGRIITAAALILLTVTGAFAFSDVVMMQYIAYGMIAALFIDATLLRMLLVPAIMKLLGDDCWWAPAWMKRIQQKIGLGEPILDDERPGGGEVVDLVKTTPITDPVTMQMPALSEDATSRFPRKPRPARLIDSEAPTQRINKTVAPDAEATAKDAGAPSGSGKPSSPPQSLLGGAAGAGLNVSLTNLGSSGGRSGPADFSAPAGVPARADADSASGRSAGNDAGAEPETTDFSVTERRSGAELGGGLPTDLPVQAAVPVVSKPAPEAEPVAPQSDPEPPAAPAPRVVGAERVLPPPEAKMPPHPATRAQLYQPHAPEEEQPAADPTAETAEQPHPTHHSAEDPPKAGGRSSIEQWMSDLRSARRRTDKDQDSVEDDEGKHRGGDGRTVSVNELLRRQNRD